MKSQKRLTRRGFLKGAAAGAAAGAAGLVVPLPEAQAQQTTEVARATAEPPSPRLLARETQPPAVVDVQTADYPGSDYMVDVIKSLYIEYLAANPGSSFRSLHESFVNYGGNKNTAGVASLPPKTS